VLAQRAALAVALLTGFYLVVAGVVVGALTLVAVGAIPPAALLYLYLVYPAAAGILDGIQTEYSPPVNSIVVRRQDAPLLWAMVVELAQRAGTRPPAELRLTAEAGAEVSTDGRMLGLLPGPRRMHIGVPLMTGLSIDQFRAIVCHELGHYAPGQTRFSAIAHRGTVSMAATLQHHSSQLRELRHLAGLPAQLGGGIYFLSWVCLWPVRWYTNAYFRVSSAVRRQHEIDADATAVKLAGKEATAEALWHAHTLRLAWERFLNVYVQPSQEFGYLPSDLFEAFAMMVGDCALKEVMEKWGNAILADDAYSRYDSHPPLARRLELIRKIPQQPTGRNLSPALQLLGGDCGNLLRAVQETIHPPVPGRHTLLPVPDWADKTAEILATRSADQLIRAAQSLTGKGTPLTLQEISGLLPDAAENLAARLPTTDLEIEADGADSDRRRLNATVYALIGRALAGPNGEGRWELSWTGSSELLSHYITSGELHSVAGMMTTHPAAATRLCQFLEQAGVQISAPLAPRFPAPEPRARTSPQRIDEYVQRRKLTRRRKNYALLLAAVTAITILVKSLHLSG